MKTKITLPALSVVLAIIFFTASFFTTKVFIDIKSDSKKVTISDAITETKEKELLEKKTRLSFVGDMMLDRSVRASVVKNFGGDYNQLFINLADLKNADILFANLEGNVSDMGNNVGSKYSFRMDPIVLPAIKNAGFDIVSFANNHVGDWNITAFKDTLKRLSDIGILQTGAGFTKGEAELPTIIERNGVRFGFIGFSDVGPDWIHATDKTAGILLASDPRLAEIIRKAKEGSDVLIASFHWGTEYKKVHNPRQETLAHLTIDSGADMVIGHHPHVIEDVEIYKEKPIVYSLGNFIFDQYFSKDTMEGMLFEATFKGKDLIETKSRIIKLNKKYQPEGIFEIEVEKVTTNTCPKPNKDYKDYSYLSVGQNISIPESAYIPSDLVPLSKDSSTATICLKKDAALAVENMIKGAQKDGYKIKVSSGFRSYNTQKYLLEQAIKNGNKNAAIAIAKPGYSEHQLGTAVDLTSSSINYASATTIFENTAEDLWLQKNASSYGLVQSYPKYKEDITGYMYEAWHYRYVGVDNAKEIVRNSQTINEFLKDIDSVET